MLKCPNCNTQLKETNVVVWKDHGGEQIIGKQQFCGEMTCDFEGKIEHKPNLT